MTMVLCTVLNVFFDVHGQRTRDVLRLRCVSLALRETVAAYAWNDEATVVIGNVAAWKSSFKCARAINMTNRLGLSVSHFEGLGALKCLILCGCEDFSDASLKAVARLCPQLNRLNVGYSHVLLTMVCWPLINRPWGGGQVL